MNFFLAYYQIWRDPGILQIYSQMFGWLGDPEHAAGVWNEANIIGDNEVCASFRQAVSVRIELNPIAIGFSVDKMLNKCIYYLHLYGSLIFKVIFSL